MPQHASIAGIAMTAFGIHRDETVKSLTRQAVQGALEDAGAGLDDIEIAFFGNMGQGVLEGQHSVPGQIALREMGLQRAGVVNVENACATGSSAFAMAVTHVNAGMADIALAVGVEKMNVGTRADSLRVFDGAYDVSRPAELEKTLIDLGGVGADAGEGDRSIFMDIYGAMTRAHMSTFGTTQAQLAVVSSKNHGHAVHNSKAHFRTAMTVDQVLAGRALGFPLTVPMCSPITDGAAAAIVCSPEGLARLTGADPVRVLSSVIGSGVDRALDDYERHITRVLAGRAYELAGVGPGDVDVAEVHDATAFGEVLQTEMLGLCELGAGGRLAASGDTTIGGRIPVNPSGGLESKGHPLGATGLGQLCELADQLRGRAGARQVDGARIAVAENGGGLYRGEEATAVITILGR
ncbi:thiolase family protein [Aeromicrobium wangtongii]|uniref:thiolase family protein n=1 Tax=Aeromicrobium wangtongii TaxID=2969247 RepID=UPI0020183D4F|nr:thiolase family protein [Aeromicrobium wangtongii]MCL3818596.1 thiolase family protein [Aeromicrobium wangtongii]